jgi:general secretion pathway protein G
LIELPVVLVIMAILMGMAVPHYFQGVERSKEAVLRQNLFLVRESIDRYFADHGRYPPALEDLVEKRYLRSAPADPVTGSTSTWVVVPPREPGLPGVYDIRSGAQGKALDGSSYADW